MYGCFACSVCTTCVAAVHGGQKRSLHPPGTAVLDSCELPFEFWEVNPGLLQEQPVLLTAELSFQTTEIYILAQTYDLYFLTDFLCVCVCVYMYVSLCQLAGVGGLGGSDD